MTRGTRLAGRKMMAPRLAAGGLSRWTAVLADYWTLTKPEVNFLILITTFTGFYLASPASHWRILLLFNTLVGTMLVASGTGTLNQYIERCFDSQMRRTSRRPLPAGRIESHSRAVVWRGALGGWRSYLAVLVNFLASSLALLTLSTYLLLYTPLKRKTPLCTLVGALPGADPVDQVGRGERKPKRRGVGSLRHSLSLAVSTFHGHCLDVSRGLRACGVSDITPR